MSKYINCKVIWDWIELISSNFDNIVFKLYLIKKSLIDILNRIKAEDRCHRVGQTKEVKVIRFTSEVRFFFHYFVVNRGGGGIYLITEQNLYIASIANQIIVKKKKNINLNWVNMCSHSQLDVILGNYRGRYSQYSYG